MFQSKVPRVVIDEEMEFIPVQNKLPLVKYKDVPITAEFIEAHQTEYQQASAMAVLCRGVWCIDIDVNHGAVNGFESLKGLPYYEELKKNALATWRQKTPSGGRHLIFKKRDGINYHQKINYVPGVDIKAHPNNYFLMGGSRTKKGQYLTNDMPPAFYVGELESQIFGSSGSYQQQLNRRYSVKNVLPDYDFSHLEHYRTGTGAGKEAYQRIIDRTSVNRNNDLFLASSYCKACHVSLEPLKVLIGDVKNGDEFTEAEWVATVESAQ